jgi:hypothetical protein
MTINLEKTEVFMVSYSDVEGWICDFFELKEYHLPAMEECSNGICLSYNLNEPINLTSYQLEEIEELKSTKKPALYTTSTYLEYMADKGCIPKGIYIVNVWW